MHLSCDTRYEGSIVLEISEIPTDQAQKIVQYATDLHFGITPPPPEPVKAELSITTMDEPALRQLAYLVKLHQTADNNKILCIKAVRFMFPGTTLKDAKYFVDLVFDSWLTTGNATMPGHVSFNYESANIPEWITWIIRS